MGPVLEIWIERTSKTTVFVGLSNYWQIDMNSSKPKHLLGVHCPCQVWAPGNVNKTFLLLASFEADARLHLSSKSQGGSSGAQGHFLISSPVRLIALLPRT